MSAEDAQGLEVHREAARCLCPVHDHRDPIMRLARHLAIVLAILALSTSTAYGFKFSNDADALVSRIIEKVAELEADLGSRPPHIH